MYCLLDGLYTIATVNSANEITCSVKAYPLLATKVSHLLWVTINKIDFHGPIEILFVPEIVILNFEPKISSINEPYFTIEVNATNIVNTGSLECSLDSKKAYAIKFISSESILCFFS